MASAGLILSRSQTADIDDRTPFDINDHFPFRLCWRKQYQSHKMTQIDTHTHTHTHTHTLSHTQTRTLHSLPSLQLRLTYFLFIDIVHCSLLHTYICCPDVHCTI